jgi:FMN phosphatase YigB (HAD superfamily)
MSIKLVVFDGGGVLYDANKANKVFFKEYDKFLKRFGSSVEEQRKIFDKLRPKLARGRISLREANKIIFRKLGVPVSALDEWLRKDLSISLKYVKVNSKARQILLALKKRGMKVTILSDTVHPFAWRVKLLKKLGILKGKHYDKLFLSSVIGYEKPERGAYITVLKWFKVKPEEAVFVGHDKEEIEGARKVGMKVASIKKLKKMLAQQKFKV